MVMSMATKPDSEKGKDRDWRWQLAKTIREIDELPSEMIVGLNRERMREASLKFPMAVSPYYFSLIDPADPNDPLRRMAIPSSEELRRTSHLEDDPIAEAEHSPLPGLIRRYPDRAVLLVSGRCAVSCRHCTRRRIGQGRINWLDAAGLDRAIDYLHRKPEIRDVILSGGDPLVLESHRLEEILARVRAVSSVEIIRVGTRVPVTLPMRINAELAGMMARFQPLYVNTQFNHPREVTAEARAAVSELIDAGIPVANQAVLLRGVNDCAETIEDLCRALLRIRVRPYYLFLCDLWDGLEHLRTSLDMGISIMEHLRGRISGLGIPLLVADLPGGIGKVPVGPDYIVTREPDRTVLRAPNGQHAVYPDPRDDSTDPS